MKIFNKAFYIVWINNKGWLIFNGCYAIVAGFIPVALIWLSKELINELALLIQNPSDLTKSITILIIQMLLIFFSSVLDRFKLYIDNKTEMNLSYFLQRKLLKKVASLPFCYYEDPQFYNYFSRVQASAGARFLNPINQIFNFTKNLIAIVSVMMFLFSIDWLLLILVIIPIIPLLIVSYKYGLKQYELFHETTPQVRNIAYITRLLSEKESVKEIKILGLANHFIKKWSIISKENNNRKLKLEKKNAFLEISIEGFKSVLYLIIVFVVMNLIRQGNLKIGDFVAILQAIEQTQNKLESISGNISSFLEDRLYLNDYFSFLDLEYYPNNQDKKADLEFPKTMKKGIDLDNVSFSYPGSTKEVLKNISLSINPGERIAIIGENGCGKSTLVKCIVGLYQVEKGNIYFDDKSINDFSTSDLHNHITVLFQNFNKYPYTVQENIGFGNVERMNDLNSIKNLSKLTKVDEFVQGLNQKYNTPLTRVFQDGEDLSGGQWQKVALTRALFRETPIIIFDEPTAALDPKSEKEIFEQFNEMTNNKTSIFISHRMSATRIADRIVVMKKGEIIEVGTFSELMDLDGEFTKMYNTQIGEFKNRELLTN